jgi:hypothetical protein
MYEYITPELFEFCENSKLKIAKRVYDNVLNYDLMAVLSDGNTWYIEKTYSAAVIPEYVYKWLKTHYKKQGLKYLYDM